MPKKINSPNLKPRSVLQRLKTKRFVAVDPKFAKERGHLFRPIFSSIRKNFAVLSKLKTSECFTLPNGVKIFNERFGSEPGTFTDAAFRVQVGNKSFFVRFGLQDAKAAFDGAVRAQKYVDSKGGKMFGYNVRVLAPKLIFWDSQTIKSRLPNGFVPFSTIVVSPFFSHKGGVSVSDLREQAGESWEKSELGRTMAAINNRFIRVGVQDASDGNAFYVSKTKTIYFFDLEGIGSAFMIHAAK